MHTRPKAIIAAGVAAGLLGFLMVLAYGRNVAGQTSPGVQSVALVTTADVPAGAKWEDVRSKLEERKVPESMRPSTAVSDMDALTGRMAVRPISAGEIVTSTQFGAAKQSGAALEVPPGHNAVTIPLGVPQGVARYVRTGDLVNLYVTFKGGAGGPQTVTKLLLPKVQVLSHHLADQEPVDKAIGASQAAETVFTLALTPQDTERLIFAKETGSVWMALVNPSDGPAATGGQTRDSVLG